jgi:hypothetical protein
MAIRTVDLQHAISISDEGASGPWQTVVWTIEFELRTCLKETCVRTVYHIVQTVEVIYPYLNFGKNLKLDRLRGVRDGLLRLPDG